MNPLKPEPERTSVAAESSATAEELDDRWATLCERAEARPEPVPKASTATPTPPSTSMDSGEAVVASMPTPAPPNVGTAEITPHSARVQGPLLPGSKFGGYVVAECIGEGGMARIYRAEHVGLRRQVALKVLTGNFAKDPEGWERFVREARIAAAVKHPNVVNIFDVGIHEGVPYLVMEFLEGTDLDWLVQQKGTLDEALILDIMVPVVAGLSAVHDTGIVHRDLKPGNIFLAKGRYDDIEPKLLDFGISKANGTDQLKLTTQGHFLGTPFYMSPEGFHGEELTPLSDQYSLGVVMYECATGRGPFVASTLPELARAVTSGAIPPMASHNPNISSRLAAIIERTMSLEPSQRYADLRELGRELLKLAGQRTRITWGLSFGEASAPPPGAPRQESIVPLAATIPPPASPFTTRRARVIRLGALATVLVVLLVVGARSFFEQKPSPVTIVAAPALATVESRARMPDTDSDEPKSAPSIEPGPTASAQGKQKSARSRTGPARTYAALGRATTPTEDQPDWAQPGASKPALPAPRPDALAGTNGAPIFD